MKGKIIIRPAGSTDLAKINAIFNYYVAHSTCVWTTVGVTSVWSSVNDMPVIVSDCFYVTNSITGPGRYNRLSSQPSPPSLAAALAGAKFVLSWATNATGYVLQFSTNLSSALYWTTVADTPVVVGTSYVVTNAVSGDRKFYRLLR